MNEEAAVEAQFDADGEITSRRFAWRGSMMPVEGGGKPVESGRRTLLVVMVMGGRPFELRLNEQTLCWRIVRAPAPKLARVREVGCGSLYVA